jgi:ribosomal protein S18 acetylase RimI-like enzyme
MSGFRIAEARKPAEIAAAASLFREYADGLGIDLGFQGFEAELRGLPGRYAPPEGALLLAWGEAGEALGCVAVRPLEGRRICEMKRLYVRPSARRLGIGEALVAAVIEAAEALGYGEMRLDTLPSMAPAATLYGRFGFVPIPAYYANPIPGTLYFGRKLARR